MMTAAVETMKLTLCFCLFFFTFSTTYVWAEMVPGSVQNCDGWKPAVNVNVKYTPAVIKPKTTYTLRGEVDVGAAFQNGTYTVSLAAKSDPKKPLIKFTNEVACDDFKQYVQRCPIKPMKVDLPNPMIPPLVTPAQLPFSLKGKYIFTVSVSTDKYPQYACVQGEIDIE